MGSDRARSILDYIAVMINEASAGQGDEGTLARIWFAPQRWIASARPLALLLEKLPHFILYAIELALDSRKGYKSFGEALEKELRD
eukprot:4328570-Karenia_brevis.AAC.1